MDMDNENKEFLILEREGTEIYYLKAKNEEEYSYMTWVSEDETTVLSIDGVLPEEELLKIWENITVVEE